MTRVAAVVRVLFLAIGAGVAKTGKAGQIVRLLFPLKCWSKDEAHLVEAGMDFTVGGAVLWQTKGACSFLWSDLFVRLITGDETIDREGATRRFFNHVGPSVGGSRGEDSFNQEVFGSWIANDIAHARGLLDRLTKLGGD
ncbi:MAG: hypothetical protein ACI97A_004105 [Planctomycetota bacterium]|jgi:hypothetical protein